MTDSLEAMALRPSIIRKNWLPLKMAVQEVLAFEQCFGKKHLLLACHAALLSYLTPELLNLVRLNFLDDENIAAIAEADFLLSPLCRPVDELLFEVEPAVREVLLVSLKRLYGKEEGEKCIVDLAAFLRRYLAEKSHQITRPDVLNTMRWIASSYLEPDFVIRELRKQLDDSLSNTENLNEVLAEQAELVVLLEKIAEPLERSPMQQEYQYLMHDSHVVAQLLYTDDPIDTTFSANRSNVNEGNLSSLISPPLINWVAASALLLVAAGSLIWLANKVRARVKNIIEPSQSVSPVTIDSEVERLLTLADWTIQDYDHADIRSERGVAIRNFPIRSNTETSQFVDYLLFVDHQAVGIVKVIKQQDDHNLPDSPTKRNVLEANLDNLIETVTLQLQPQPRAQATASTLQQLSTFIPNDVILADLVVGWRTLSHSAQNEEEIATTRRRSTCGELADIASQFTTEQGNIEQAIKTWRIWHNAFANSDDSRQVTMANTFARELSELEAASPVIFVMEDNENRISLEKTTLLSRSLSMLNSEKLHLNPISVTYETDARVPRVRFTNYLDPVIHTRSVFAFHRPETVSLWLQQVPANVGKNRTDLLRARLLRMPVLEHIGLSDVQYDAIVALEKSLAENRQRSLIQIMVQNGKTNLMISIVHRLLKFGNAQRVLYLTDNDTLAQQALQTFDHYIPVDNKRKFTEIYTTKFLSGASIDPTTRVCIGTALQLYAFLYGQTNVDSLVLLYQERERLVTHLQYTTNEEVKIRVDLESTFAYMQLTEVQLKDADATARQIEVELASLKKYSHNYENSATKQDEQIENLKIKLNQMLVDKKKLEAKNAEIQERYLQLKMQIEQLEFTRVSLNTKKMMLEQRIDEMQPIIGIEQEIHPIQYNKSLPIEVFDIIIIDECNRKMIEQFRSTLEYFDAFLIGLAVIEEKSVLKFFNNNVVYKQQASIRTPRIFISHSSKDDEFSTKLAEDLREELGEKNVWYDNLRLNAGDRWWRTVVEELALCDVFILIISPASMQSDWVRREYDIAFREEKRTIPLLYRETVAIWNELKGIHHISVTSPEMYERAFNILLREIRSIPM